MTVMPWTPIANIQGPQGPPGPPGGPGPPGAPGTSFDPALAVPTVEDLPSGDPNGTARLVISDGHLYAKEASGWTDVGEIRGPQGPQGQQGTTGSPGPPGTRGTNWYTGSGVPGSIGGSLPGDLYLDTATGNVYTLS